MTVASVAGISRTTLYRDPTLRMMVEEHRTHSHDPRTMSGLVSEIGHLRTAVEALAEILRVIGMEPAGEMQADFVNVTRQVAPAVHRFARAARINDFAHNS